VRLRELRRSHVKEFLAAKRERASLSKNTLRLIRAALSAMLADALDDELIPSNPAAVPIRRRGRKGNGILSASERQKAIRPLTERELAAFLAAARSHDPELYPLFLLLARTGMRPGEALALQWPDIDFSNRRILIERALADGELGSTKTDSIRTVDMSHELALALSTLYRAREAQALRSGSGEVPELIFVNAASNPLDISRVRKRFSRLMRHAAISGHRLYDLRHTFATTLLAKGAPITYVAAQLGHAKPTTTLQYYARWLPQASAAFVDRLDSDESEQRSGTNLAPIRPPAASPAPSYIEKSAISQGFFGAPSETRTPDPLIKSQLLYQLS